MPGRNHQVKDLSVFDEVFAERDKNFLYPCCYGGTPAQASSQSSSVVASHIEPRYVTAGLSVIIGRANPSYACLRILAHLDDVSFAHTLQE